MVLEKDIEQTPFISVDLNKLQHNIRDMQAIADKAGLTIRPHAKTHKCSHIAKLQLEAGAVGLTVAKPEEAIAFIKLGVPSVKICYPVISAEKIDAVLKTAQEYSADVRFVIDSEIGFNIIEEIGKCFGKKIPVYVEVDVGLNRCGLKKDNPLLVDLCERAFTSSDLAFIGLTSHAGQAYGGGSPDETAAIAEEERQILMQVKQALEERGIKVEEICVGSTPTLWAQKNFDGLSEIKPGNYVFNDLTEKNIGVVNWDRLALSVITTVVSVNDTYMIIDAGSKTMTSDMGAHGTSKVKGFGLAFLPDQRPDDETGLPIEKLSEEHGFIRHNGNKLPVGTRLRLYPNHSCPVVNLFDVIHIFENGSLKDKWPVEARGCVH